MNEFYHCLDSLIFVRTNEFKTVRTVLKLSKLVKNFPECFETVWTVFKTVRTVLKLLEWF